MTVQTFEQVTALWGSTAKHVIAVTGRGVTDMVGDMTIPNFMARWLARSDQRFLVVQFTMSYGIEFPYDSMVRAERVKAAELGLPDPHRNYIDHEEMARQIAPPPAASGLFQGVAGMENEAETDAPLPSDTQGALEWLDNLMQIEDDDIWPDTGQKISICVLFPHADLLWPESPAGLPSQADRANIERVMLWMENQQWVAGYDSPLVLLFSETLEAMNRRLTESGNMGLVDVPTPDATAREDHIRDLAERYDVVFAEGMDPHRMANMCAAMRLSDITDVMMQALTFERALDDEFVRGRVRTAQEKRFGGVLKIEEPQGTLDDVAGMPHIVEYFRNFVIPALRSGDPRGLPKGIMFMGPPGTGKTHLAQALASEGGVNFASLSIGAIYDKWLGESEKRIRIALDAAEAQAPCLLFIDEFDTGFRRREESSGNSATANIMGALLMWASRPDLQGRVLIIAATNNPGSIDGAVLRSGRFDLKLAIMPPESDEDRVSVMTVTSRIRNLPLADTCDLARAASLTEGWTGADFGAVMELAYSYVRRSGREVIDTDDLLRAVGNFLPSRLGFQRMADEALLEINNKELLPPSALKRREELLAARGADNTKQQVISSRVARPVGQRSVKKVQGDTDD